MTKKKMIRNSVAAAAVFGAVIAGGSAIASAQTDSSAPASESASSDTGSSKGGGAPHEHTAVTGDELTKVTDAVTAYDSLITVNQVQKDPDGSYDVDGTKDGSAVRLDVSSDLKTITEGKGGRGGKSGHGGGQDTPVTGDEATKASDAVTAKDSAVTVESVQKDPDGSYDVLGTKDGQKIAFDVSADLQTVTER